MKTTYSYSAAGADDDKVYWQFSDELAAKMVFQLLLLTGAMRLEDSWRVLHTSDGIGPLLAPQRGFAASSSQDYVFGALQLTIEPDGTGTETDPFIVAPSIEFGELARAGSYQLGNANDAEKTALGWFARSCAVHTNIGTGGAPDLTPAQLFQPQQVTLLDDAVMQEFLALVGRMGKLIPRDEDASRITREIQKVARVALINAKGGNLRPDRARQLELAGYTLRTGRIIIRQVPFLKVWIGIPGYGEMYIYGPDLRSDFDIPMINVCDQPVRIGEEEGSLTIIEGVGVVRTLATKSVSMDPAEVQAIVNEVLGLSAPETDGLEKKES
jgi:hypothetical protein